MIDLVAMEEAQLQTSKSSGNAIAFPRYRRAHLKSQTYSTLLCILSHFDYENSKPCCPPQTHTATQEMKIHDAGVDKTGRKNQGSEPERLIFLGPDVIDPNNPVFSSKSNAPERFEGVGVQGRELSDVKMVVDDIELMMGLEDDEGSSRWQDMMIYESVGMMSPEANGLTKEQKLMDELEQIVKGSEKLLCGTGLSPPNVGLVEKRNGSSEVELMDNRLEGLEFQQSKMNNSGPSGESQVEGEFSQHASEGFQSSLSANISKSSINEQSSLLEISALNINHEGQQKEMAITTPACAVLGSPPISEEGEFEEGDHLYQKDTEIIGISLNQDMISEMSNSNESGGDRKLLLDTGSLDAEGKMHHIKEQSGKLSFGDGAATSSSHMIEGGDVEEGEISGDLGMDENPFDMSSVDISMLPQNIEDEVTRAKIVTEKNIRFPCNIWNGERDYKSTSFTIDVHQDTNKSGQVEPRESERKLLVCGDEAVEPRETIRFEKAGDYGLVLAPGKSKDRDGEGKEAVDLRAALAYDQVWQRQLSEEHTGDDGNSSPAKQKASVDGKKKRGPLTEARKAKRKQQKRKKRAEKNRQLGVKRLKLLPVQKPKPIIYCRHYLNGKCYEGDKCKFSHDTVPLTKSKPCCHFARHSCMKGDECPFDHQLSKYPCSNFVSKGSCSRGDACLFSHKMPTKEDISPVSKVSNDCRSELKPSLVPVNTNFSQLLHVDGSSASQQNHLSDSWGIHPLINIKHEAADVVRKPLTLAPKGISFINVSKSSLPKPSTLEQGTVTAKESVVQIKTHTDKSLSGTAQNLEETPKKMPAVAPKGINFLSFGKGRLSSSNISVCSFLNKDNVIKLPQLNNFGLPEQSGLSLNNDDHNKIGHVQQQSVLQAALFSNESLKKSQSVAGGMNSDFLGKALVDKSATDIQCSLTSHQDHILSKSAQKGVKESDNSQISTAALSVLPLSPFVSGQCSESLASGHHKYASNSAQKALFSTLAFAAKHEPDIKMK